ncbi:DUF1801 domain-containing protein [Colwellia sp. 1_MG-2023]|uniref:iron chaperone n=1 Tax=Colwellia sp. 1_MG-2023 TaxID=3062649 RepID=UPI0026E44AFA|nr:DUF1801 domain-containing protein [Colwellia sp. 1_MG-2023]MDO6444922.1 DUF1801 domain-containing protein [Colwellia sp. 1_MG-2023]
MNLTTYLKNIPEQRRARFNAIHSLILNMYPDVEQSMKYKMPTFSLGKHWIALANQKSYLSLYTCSADHLVAFQKMHPKIKTGKGCINIKDNDQFDITDLSSVITSALTENVT